MGYEAVLARYKGIEDFHGKQDPIFRGQGGPMYLENAQAKLHPFPGAVLGAAASVGIPRFPNPNGQMMEEGSGCAPTDRIFQNLRRQSVCRSYAFPMMIQPNLTVLKDVLVTRLTFDGKRTTGVEVLHQGQTRQFTAHTEVIVSAGAVETPKVLMQSGIGNQDELKRFGIPVVQHLPGVRKTFRIIRASVVSGSLLKLLRRSVHSPKQWLSGKAIPLFPLPSC